MPLSMGMGLGVNRNTAAAVKMLPSLAGHLVYGAVLGLSYALLKNKNVASAVGLQTATGK